MVNPYIGHEHQVSGVEIYKLQGGKGDGMTLYEVFNGKGLRMTISADRCADISKLSFRGNNYSYFSPAGYVASEFYDRSRDHFLNSFTAGFLTTCGLTNAGVPCSDEGEDFPLHGSIANTPAEHIYYDEDDSYITIHAIIRDERLFARKLVLKREIKISKLKNSFELFDKVVNNSESSEPVCILYHCNMGYPLLSENTRLYVKSKKVTPRDERAAEGIEKWNVMEKPQRGFKEQCYFHTFDKTGEADVYNDEIGSGLQMKFDSSELNYFTEWKMMGYRDYALGLEPANTHVLGRDIMRKEGKLQILKSGEEALFHIEFNIIEDTQQLMKIME